MALKVYKFNTVDEMNRFLAGSMVGKELVWPTIYGLVGTKMKFVLPTAVEYTFVAGADSSGGLTFDEIKTQLEGGVTGLTVTRTGKSLVLTGGSTGVELDAASANPGANILGFSNLAGGKTLAYAKPGSAAPALVQVFAYGTQMGAVVEEA